MAELFNTVYKKDYKEHLNHKRRGLLLPLDIYAASQQDDRYLQLGKTNAWSEESEELIKRMHQNRMKTSYTVSYCREPPPAPEPIPEDSEIEGSETESVMDADEDEDTIIQEPSPIEDVMMNYFSNLYELPKTQKLLPPLPTSRRVYGYCRPAYLYTQLSNYQVTICKTGFDILKKDLDRGINRLGPRRIKLEDLKPIE